MDLTEKEKEIAQAQEELLKRKQGSDGQKRLRWRTYASVSLWQFKEDGCEEDQIVVGQQS